MKIKTITYDFSICKVKDYSQIDLHLDYCFTAKTEEENSLVCLTENVPENAIERNDGWIALQIEGVLDFSLIGVLARISVLLAEHEIGIFVTSTYNTDYIFVKKEDCIKATETLAAAGYDMV